MAMPFITHADLHCPPGSGRLLDVSGTSTASTSTSTEIQSGVMHLTLSDASGVVYEKDCGLIGKIVKETVTESLLDHTVICSPKDSFNTSGDVATVTRAFPPIFNIKELISNIKEGEGFFKNMKVEMEATGTINLAPFPDLVPDPDPSKPLTLTVENSFTLTGQVCVKHNN